MKLLKLGLAASALALTTLGAQAQTTDNSSTGTASMGTASTGTTSMSMAGSSDASMSASASMAPTPVSGTVTRYYVDGAGFVSAMDVQTASGTQMVRFQPSMAQRLTAQFPVGSTISGFVTPSSMGGFDLAGTGATAPMPGAMMPASMNDLDILRAPAYTTIGAKEEQVEGKVTGYISDPNNGDVLALILDNSTLVRVPKENRIVSSTMGGAEETELMAGATVAARGVEEAPRFGVISPFTRRIVATAIEVNGRAVGSAGFGRLPLTKSAKKMLFGYSGANSMGYSPYMMPGTDASMSTSTSTSMSSSTSSTSSTTTTPAQ